VVEIYAITVGEDRQVQEVSYDRARELAKATKQATWIHIRHSEPQKVADLLANDFDFHPLAIEDAVSKDERPELKEFDDHVFLVAPAVTTEPNELEEQFEEIGFFVRDQLMVTVVDAHVPCLRHLTDRWMNRKTTSRTEIGYLLFAILDAILDDYFPRLDRIEEQVDAIGDEIYEGSTEKLKDLLRIKHQMLDLRRRLGPFRDVMSSLMRRELDFVTPKLEPYYQDLFDNTLRLTELIDTNRDALTSLIDIHLSTVSNNLNQVMKKMTVISTVLMSSALIAGVYGMNFDVIPELHWGFGYPFAILLMVASSFAIIWLFRRKRWI
jgi:magnesium transporter